ncbi:MAG: dihydrodipicolinate synthase family protein [Verrucomicrobia bacterium]|nr:dihydrodipicolinate synthase family protein [Verrucomicrobiota bacterium]
MSDYPLPPAWVRAALLEGLVIPAHPLALTSQRKLDERRQRALTRYYHAAGAGGVAVGVHTTQFEIRDPRHGLLAPVLWLARETVTACDAATGRTTVCVAGLCGRTEQALAEARLAREHGYHAGLLSLAALKEADDETLIRHCRAVAQEIPLFGFYLQPAVGGRVLSVDFWRRFAEIPNVVAIKIAPFNRYQTLDVVRAVAEVGRADDIALYTGNDDHILLDLLSEYALETSSGTVRVHIAGGLLGHWAFWTRRAVELLDQCKAARARGQIPGALLTLAEQVTDANAAVFDAAHGFAGCIPGIHEVLRRQGLLENNLCLNPAEQLSPTQTEEITRVSLAYPHLSDDEFVSRNLAAWLA